MVNISVYSVPNEIIKLIILTFTPIFCCSINLMTDQIILFILITITIILISVDIAIATGFVASRSASWHTNWQECSTCVTTNNVINYR